MTYYIFTQNVLFHAWTDNEYIMSQYINLDMYRQYDMTKFEGTYSEFSEYLKKEYNVSYMASYKLQLILGRGLKKYATIASGDLIDTALFESGMWDEAAYKLILSLYKLRKMSDYILDDRMTFYMEYIFRRYILDLIDYIQGVDDTSERFDPIYVLQQENYLGVL